MTGSDLGLFCQRTHQRLVSTSERQGVGKRHAGLSGGRQADLQPMYWLFKTGEFRFTFLQEGLECLLCFRRCQHLSEMFAFDFDLLGDVAKNGLFHQLLRLT